MVSLLGCLETKALPLRASLGLKSCSSQSFSPMISLDDWYAGVHALLTVWPDVSMLGADNLHKVAGYDFHLLWKKYDVQSIWGDLDPQWRLLKNQLETKGAGLVFAHWARRGFLQTSRIGLVMTWKMHCVLMETLWRGRPGVLPEPALAVALTCSTLSVSGWTRFSSTCIPKSGRKNKLFPLHLPVVRKMCLWGDERRGSRVTTVPWLGSHHAACAGVRHVYWWRDATSGSCFRACGWNLFGHLVFWPTVLEEGCIVLSNTQLFLEAGVPG